MDFLQMCKLRYYNGTSASAVKLVQDKLGVQNVICRPEFVCVFDSLLSNSPCNYYDEDAYAQTSLNLEALIAKNQSICIDEPIIEHYLTAYHTYIQVTEIINDLSGLNNNDALRNRQYRIPTYISIVEGCLTNIFRCISLLLTQASDKDYSQIYKLGPLCEIMKKNGFDLLVTNIDIDIRNAINHGGIIQKENGHTIDFHFNKNHQSMFRTVPSYEMEHLLEKVYDTSSAAILAVTTFLNSNWDKITLNHPDKSFASFCLSGMKLSVPGIQCRYITDTGDNKQLNIDIQIDNTERAFILQTAVILSLLVYEQYNDYEQYFISFSNERLQTSWVRFKNKELYDVIAQTKTLDEIVENALRRHDVIIFDPSTEDISLQEIKHFRFPNYKTHDYFINRVSDASTPDRKRIKCHLFVGEETDKDKLLAIISQSIAWAKELKNVDSPTLHQKCGEMEADSVYINVYRHDGRKGKELFPNNENFVCFVDYNIDGITTLKYGGLPFPIWKQLHLEKRGLVDIAWREGRYAQRVSHKIGANDLCPCGSGKKFKKCCRGKGLYD